VPEPVELLAAPPRAAPGGGGRGDDGDAGDEVEVALAVVGDEPRAVAVDERDGKRAYVGSSGVPVSDAHARPPPSADRRRDAVARGA
jgi:hypothetical protein